MVPTMHFPLNIDANFLVSYGEMRATVLSLLQHLFLILKFELLVGGLVTISLLTLRQCAPFFNPSNAQEATNKELCKSRDSECI